MNVTRTNPHVACGSSFSRLRTSSAVNSSGICVTGFLEGRCAFTANSGVTTAAPMNVARLRKFRRPTNSESRGFDMVISSITFDYEDNIMQIIPVEIEKIEWGQSSLLAQRMRFMVEEDSRHASMIPLLSVGLAISISSWFASAGLEHSRPALRRAGAE